MGRTNIPNSDEKLDYWCGPCPNKGDAFTYWILLPDGNTILDELMMRYAKYDQHPNMRLKEQLNELNPLVMRDDSDINIPNENEELNGEGIDNETQPFSRCCSLDLLSETLSELHNKILNSRMNPRLILLKFMRII